MADFAIPIVHPADIILHSRDGRPQSYRPAIVHRVADDTIDLTDLVSRQEYPGVRYAKDPRLNEEQKETFGCWLEGEAVKRNNEVQSRLTKLEEQVAVLLGVLSDEIKTKDRK